MELKKALIFCMCLASAYCCTEEPAPDLGAGDTVAVTLSASSDGSSTKAAVGSGNTIDWVEGDAISLLDGDDYYELVLSDGAGTNVGLFSGDVPAATAADLDGCTAVYPYSGQNSIDGEVLTIDWAGSLTQTAVKNSFDPSSCLMAGIVDIDGNVAFKNIMSFIKFTVDFDCAGVSISNLASDASVKVGFDSDGIPVLQGDMMDMSKSKTVSLAVPGEGIMENGTYMLAVLPQEMQDGFTISFIDDSGKVYTKTTVKSVTFRRGHILNIGSFSRSSLTAENAFEGNGTEASPYLITSLEKLKLLDRMFSTRTMVDAVRGKYFKQTADIDCGGQIVHVGHYIVDKSFSGNDLDAPFDGTYDGNGKKITNYRLGSVEMRNEVFGCGLFPYIKHATIRNLTVSPCCESDGHTMFRAQEEDYEYVIGCLVGMGTAGYYTSSGSSISNCHVLAGQYDIYGRESSASSEACQAITYGGIVGRSPQKIEITDCSSAADIYIYGGFAKSMATDIEAIAGGIVGKIHNHNGDSWTSTAEIQNCRNTGTVHIDTDADNAFCGGIAGYIYDQGFGNSLVHILNCVNSGYIYAYGEKEKTYAGGIIGFNNSDGDVDDNVRSRDPWVYNSLNTGTIEAVNGEDCSAAGIIGAGYDADTEVIYCVNTGAIYAQSLYSTAVRAALCGKATSTSIWPWTSIPAYCVGCYWISDMDGSGKPVLPIIGISNPEPGDEYDDDDYFDCYCYTTAAESGPGPLTPYVINNRIYQGWDAKDSANGCGEWTKAVWLAKAAKWVWRNGNLDLDFTQLISL